MEKDEEEIVKDSSSVPQKADSSSSSDSDDNNTTHNNQPSSSSDSDSSSSSSSDSEDDDSQQVPVRVKRYGPGVIEINNPSSIKKDRRKSLDVRLKPSRATTTTTTSTGSSDKRRRKSLDVRKKVNRKTTGGAGPVSSLSASTHRIKPRRVFIDDEEEDQGYSSDDDDDDDDDEDGDRPKYSRHAKSLDLGGRPLQRTPSFPVTPNVSRLTRSPSGLLLSGPQFTPGPETASLFGIKPWRNVVSNPSIEEAEFLYRPANTIIKHRREKKVSLLSLGNILWVIMFGWLIALAYTIAAGFMYITWTGRPYASLCWMLAKYYFWPFGKFLMRRYTAAYYEVADLFTEDKQGDEPPAQENTHLKPRDHIWEPPEIGCRGLIYAIWLVIATFVAFFHALAICFCWLIVFFIPMAKLNAIAVTVLYVRPLEIYVETQPTEGEVKCCTYQAAHYLYYRYNAGGLNVVLLNLLSFVVLSLGMGYLLPLISHDLEPPAYAVFACCILSIVPLAYYIGMAVASIANQTNFAIGAMLNAMFGVSIEIILYGSAILNGGLTELIQAGVVGSLLGDLLLLPGLAMIAGGIKYKEQRFSPAVAGVSSVMLIVSAIGVFTPTIFWHIAGTFDFDCDFCAPYQNNGTYAAGPMPCRGCHYTKVDLDNDPIYMDRARPLMYICAGILPVCYLVGLLFTLKTHSYIFKNIEESEGHTGPEWTKTFSTVVLGVSIGLFALISEKAIEALEPTLETLGINQLFAGVSVMALVPSSAEYVNAIGFALSNNVALSLEIGATSAVQISLIMVPVLVAFSAVVHEGKAEDSLTLLFNPFSFFAIIMSVIIVNYISIEGIANYFKGAVLVGCYCLFITAFYFLSL